MQKILYKKKKLKTTPLIDYSLNPLFTPVFDATDHFSFMCNGCHEVAEVLMVDRNDRYADTPTIYFWLFCPHCQHRGVRKIYLEDTGKHQLRFPIETKLLANTLEACQPGIIRR